MRDPVYRRTVAGQGLERSAIGLKGNLAGNIGLTNTDCLSGQIDPGTAPVQIELGLYIDQVLVNHSSETVIRKIAAAVARNQLTVAAVEHRKSFVKVVKVTD